MKFDEALKILLTGKTLLRDGDPDTGWTFKETTDPTIPAFTIYDVMADDWKVKE